MQRMAVMACVLLGCASTAWAAKVDVHLTDGHGHGVDDAVITLTPDGAPDRAANTPPSATHIVDQKDEVFIPYVQVMRPGDKVVFRNSDSTRHHVYSFSKVKAFEFVLSPGESSPAMTVDNQGIAAVGCNIHDHMITYLFVSDAPAIAMSTHGGLATLDHLAAGHYTMHVWHPQLHPGKPETTRAVIIANEMDVQHVALDLSLIPDPRMFMDREHLDY
jgi:plastocyanin